MPALTQKIELVPLDSLQPHPRNPRQGDIGAVMASIAANGWFGAALVQRVEGRPDTIVGGEHRWRALTALTAEGFTLPDGRHRTYAELAAEVPLPPAGKVPIIARAWTDEQALRILLADNRTSDLAMYDDGALASILVEFATTEGGFDGTGYDGDDLDALLRQTAGADGRLPIDPESEWTGMPGFNQQNLQSAFHTAVHFATVEDADRFFAEVVHRTKAASWWWPDSDGHVGSTIRAEWVADAPEDE